MAVRVTDGGLGFTATIDDAEIDRVAARIEARLTSLGKKVKQQGDELDNWAKKLAGLAASYATFTEGKELISNIIRVRGEFQQLEIAFTTMLKSKEEADKLMANVVKLAATTPFGLQDVATGAKQLLAYGTAAKDITPTLSMLGNIASGVGAPLNDIVYLYGTLQTQGRAYAKDIQQFTGRGIPIIKELAAQFKVADSEVMGLVESGRVGFPEVQKAFEAMTSSSGIFFNLMQEQSKSLTGQLSNLEDSFDGMLNAIGKSNEGILNSGIAGLSVLIQNYQKVLDIVGLLVVVYGSYRAALILEAALAQIAAARTVGMTTAELLHLAAISAKTAALRIMNTVMAASPVAAYTALISVLTVAIYSLSQTTNAAAASQKALGDLAASYQGKLAEEKLQMEELVKVAKSKKSTDEDRATAIKKLNELNPEFLKGLNAQNIATKEGSEAIKEYLKWLEQKLQGEAAYAVKSDAVKRIAERNAKALVDPTDKGLDFTTRLGYSLKNFFKGRAMTSARDEATDIVKQLNQQDQAIIDAVDKQYADQLKNRVTGGAPKIENKPSTAKNRAFYEKIVKDNQDALNALDKGLKDFEQQAAPLKAKIRAAQLELLAFDVNDKQNKELEKWGDKKLEILNRLADEEAALSARSKTLNQKEVEDARNKYNSLRKELEKYNSKAPKAQRIGAGTFGRIDAMEQAETGDIQYRQQTETLKNSLDKQKALYDEFEDYKAKVGISKAKERYAKEIDTSKSYLQKLQVQYSLTYAQGLLTGFTGPLQERLILLTKQSNDEEKIQNQKNDDLIKSLVSYEQTRAAMIDTYQKNRLKLVAKGNTQEVAVLDEIFKDALGRFDDEKTQKLDAYKSLFEGIEKLSGKSAKKVIADGKSMLEKLISSGQISKELAKQISDQLLKSNQSLESRLPQRLKSAATELTNIANIVGDINSGFGQWLSSLSNVIGNIGQLKEQIDEIRKLPKGDVFGQLTGGLGLFSTAMSIGETLSGIFTKAGKAQAEQLKYNNDLQIKQNEALMRSLDRQLAVINQIYGTERLTKYADAIKAIGSATDDVSSQLSQKFMLSGNKELDEKLTKINNGEQAMFGVTNEEFIKKNQAKLDALKVNANDLIELQKLIDSGKLDDTTTKLAQSLIDLKQKAIDAANSIKEALTGTSFESFADSIVDMFAQGNAAAADFGKNFEDIMKKAILNSFKTKAIAGELQKFYDQFAEFSQSGSQLTKDEIAQLKTQYDKIIAEGQSKFNDLEKVTGVLFNGSGSSTTLQGQVTALTEDTGSKIVGAFNGMRLTQLETNVILRNQFASMARMEKLATDNLAVANKIEANTKATSNNTADALPYLKDIAQNTKDTLATQLRAAGKYGY